MNLRCNNPDCASHEDGQYQFSINVTVDESRRVVGLLQDVRPEYFICCFCEDTARE